MDKLKIEFIGGEFDGMTRTLEEPPEWVWVGPDKRCWTRPAEGRVPYYAVSSARSGEEQSQDRRQSYLYAGHSHTICGGCGALHAVVTRDGDRVTRCGLCSHPLGKRQTA